jgi:FLVCR family feline leukemia virus subgroup C receptor-related protein
VNSLPTQTFSSINSLVTAKFNYNQVLLTLNTLFFPIFHPIFAFPANWILDKYGMKIGCVIGGVLVVAGVWLRTFLQENSILLCLIGSALAAVGNIFILNSSSILANNWFKHSSIPLIITLAVLSNLISITLGGGLPGLLLNINNTA